MLLRLKASRPRRLYVLALQREENLQRRLRLALRSRDWGLRDSAEEHRLLRIQQHPGVPVKRHASPSPSAHARARRGFHTHCRLQLATETLPHLQAGLQSCAGTHCNAACLCQGNARSALLARGADAPARRAQSSAASSASGARGWRERRPRLPRPRPARPRPAWQRRP